MQPKVAPWKRKKVEELVKLMEEYPIVGVVSMANLPAPPLQKMRARLRETLILTMTKKRLMVLAIEKAKEKKKGIEALKNKLTGMPALIFTRENPFKIFRILKKAKSSAPAKAGQVAPHDITVPAGPTPFSPGPIIGELGSLGIKTGVENGKVAIKEDTVVVRAGEEINQKTAELLTRLGIEPMEVGLDLVAVYEDGSILDRSVLDIDEEEYVSNFMTAAKWAFNLAVEAGYPAAETIPVLIANAHRNAFALAVSQAVASTETIRDILALANSQANALHSMIE